MSEVAFRLDGIAKNYANGTSALGSTTFDIARGSFISLVGPSGCGKSTLLRLMAGLIDASEGKIDRSGGARMGFVFQDATLMPWADIAANVALPLRLMNANTGDVDGTLQRVGLQGFASAYPRELSGGMKMRASLARAIITNPQALLMDEPFAALDEFTRFKLNDDLLALWQLNRWTVVFVTHSIREAVFLSQRVLVMSPRPGRIVADVKVRLPDRREAALRGSHVFSDQCAEISKILEKAMIGAERAA